MAVLGLYDTHVMGYRVKVMPYVIGIFDDENVIDGQDTLEYHGVIPPENIE